MNIFSRNKDFHQKLNPEYQYCIEIWEKQNSRKFHRVFAGLTMFFALCWYLSSL